MKSYFEAMQNQSFFRFSNAHLSIYSRAYNKNNQNDLPMWAKEFVINIPCSREGYKNNDSVFDISVFIIDSVVEDLFSDSNENTLEKDKFHYSIKVGMEDWILENSTPIELFDYLYQNLINSNYIDLHHVIKMFKTKNNIDNF